MITEISYDEIKDIKVRPLSVVKRKEGKYYAYKDENDEIISIMNVTDNKNFYKFHCNFTKEQYRGKGYFSLLLSEVIKKYTDKPIRANCLESSYKIYLKNGFQLKREKQFKYYKIYYMEKGNK